jgi:hypothetical protein
VGHESFSDAHIGLIARVINSMFRHEQDPGVLPIQFIDESNISLTAFDGVSDTRMHGRRMTYLTAKAYRAIIAEVA